MHLPVRLFLRPSVSQIKSFFNSDESMIWITAHLKTPGRKTFILALFQAQFLEVYWFNNKPDFLSYSCNHWTPPALVSYLFIHFPAVGLFSWFDDVFFVHRAGSSIGAASRRTSQIRLGRVTQLWVTKKVVFVAGTRPISHRVGRSVRPSVCPSDFAFLAFLGILRVGKFVFE